MTIDGMLSGVLTSTFGPSAGSRIVSWRNAIWHYHGTDDTIEPLYVPAYELSDESILSDIVTRISGIRTSAGRVISTIQGEPVDLYPEVLARIADIKSGVDDIPNTQEHAAALTALVGTIFDREMAAGTDAEAHGTAITYEQMIRGLFRILSLDYRVTGSGDTRRFQIVDDAAAASPIIRYQWLIPESDENTRTRDTTGETR